MLWLFLIQKISYPIRYPFQILKGLFLPLFHPETFIEILHSFRAFLPHAFRNMTVNVGSETRCRMTEALTHGFQVIPGLKSVDRVTMAEGVKPEVSSPDFRSGALHGFVCRLRHNKMSHRIRENEIMLILPSQTDGKVIFYLLSLGASQNIRHNGSDRQRSRPVAFGRGNEMTRPASFCL